MKKKPVVLIIENSIDITGALKSITYTSSDLRDLFDFRFVIPKHSKGRQWIESNGFSRIYELPMKEISKRISSIVLYFPYLIINSFRLGKIIKQNHPSIIHVNDLYNLLGVTVRLLGYKIPYVCHVRFLPDRFPKWLFDIWLKLHFKNACKIIAVSKSVQRMLPPHSNLEVIPGELPLREKYPESIDTGVERNKKTFLYLSNFMTGKGQNFALEAFAKIHHGLPEWKLKFVGGDMSLRKNKFYRVKLSTRAFELGIEEKVEWQGFTDDVEREYKKADIVLNFSESESFSITCLEALFFGRPLIATDCGGPSEIIDHGETGILVPNRDIKAMAKAMQSMALNEQLRIKLSQSARRAVRNNFSAEKTSLRLREIYEIILKNIK